MTGSDPTRPPMVSETDPMQCPACRRVGRQIRECDAKPCELQKLRDIADAHDRENQRLADVDGYQFPRPEVTR